MPLQTDRASPEIVRTGLLEANYFGLFRAFGDLVKILVVLQVRRAKLGFR